MTIFQFARMGKYSSYLCCSSCVRGRAGTLTSRSNCVSSRRTSATRSSTRGPSGAAFASRLKNTNLSARTSTRTGLSEKQLRSKSTVCSVARARFRLPSRSYTQAW